MAARQDQGQLFKLQVVLDVLEVPDRCCTLLWPFLCVELTPFVVGGQC